MPVAIPNASPGISEKELYKQLDFTPHSPGQAEYLYSKARFNIPCCGRRYGKSIVAGRRMTFKSFVPHSYNWIIGPTYKLGEKEFRVVWADYMKLGLLKYCRKGYSVPQGSMYIITPWNAHIEVVSADKPDSLLGEGLSHAIMSEAARHDRSTWEQYVEPALSDLLGTCDFPSTPKGYNWYHGMWLLGQEAAAFATDTFNNDTSSAPTNNAKIPEFRPGMSQYRSWQFPTWENNVRFPGGLDNPEIKRVKSVASEHWFAQEYGAEFTTMTGRIYSEWNEETQILTGPYQFMPHWANYLAFDYGFSNPFVCLDIQVDQEDNCIVWREYYKQYMSTHDHGIYLRDRERPPGYHVDAMWGDPRGADQAATLAPLIGFVAQEDVSWSLAVEETKRLMKFNKVFVHESCTNLLRQLRQLHVKEVGRQSRQELQELAGDGNIQHKVDDHAADALRYMIGPYYVNGAGLRLADVYDSSWTGSESQDFFTHVHDSVTLDTRIQL